VILLLPLLCRHHHFLMSVIQKTMTLCFVADVLITL